MKCTRVASAMLLALVLPMVFPGPTTATATPASCTDSLLAVSLGPGQPADRQAFVRLCLPAGSPPDTVQLLVHGCLYNGRYWDFPDPTLGSDRYSFVSHAVDAGYATLAVDMLGTGHSSHPPSTLTTVDAGVWVIHQVVQALRGSGIPGPGGPVGFAHVIEVAWSFGVFFSWLEVSRYHDVDAAILMSATHHLAVSPPLLADALSLYPAGLDPQFPGLLLDPGYLTTQPGTRKRIFYDPGAADPAVIADDEAHKDLMTDAEVAGFPGALAEPLDIRVPVLLVLGSADPLFCGPLATDCSSAAALVAQERPYLGPAVPSVTGYLLPGSGHAVDLMLATGDVFTVAQNWATATLPPR
jgi:pimeloyl-ACP methyl ester carboxylesterase